jgi:hypothetical protein
VAAQGTHKGCPYADASREDKDAQRENDSL